MSEQEDLWAKASGKCQRLAQDLVNETRWMQLLPAGNAMSIRWGRVTGLEFNPQFKTPCPVHQASASDQLLAAQNLPQLFALIEREVEAAKVKNAKDAETMELTRLVLADVLAEDGK